MIPVLYESSEKEFTACGIGELADAISCEVTEELGGNYYLEMTYPTNGIHYSDIAIGRLIKAAPAPSKEANIFCITTIDYSIDGVIKVYAPQEMYLRSESTIRYVHAGEYNWSKGDGASGDDVADVFAALVGMARPQFTQARGLCTFSGDFSLEDGAVVTVEWEDEFPTFLQTIYAVADAFGGEVEWGFNSVRIVHSRGENTGLEIRYGVNVTKLDAETDAAEAYTAILATTDDRWTIRYSSGTDGFPWQRIKVVDVSKYVDDDYTLEDLENIGDRLLAEQGKLRTSIKVEFDVDGQPNVLTNVERIRNLYIGDTVIVVHPGLELAQQARIVKTVFNVLLERYESMHVGEIQKDITDTIAAMLKKG